MLNSARLFADLLSLCKQLTENRHGSAWIFTSWKTIAALQKASFDVGWPIESLLVWDKEFPGPGSQRGLRGSYEMVALFCHKGFRIQDRKIRDTIRRKWSISSGSHHPAEKPVDLLQEILSWTMPALVLDPFAGSGSTLCAAKQLGLESIGIEVEERYCRVSVDRLSGIVSPAGVPIDNDGDKSPEGITGKDRDRLQYTLDDGWIWDYAEWTPVEPHDRLPLQQLPA